MSNGQLAKSANDSFPTQAQVVIIGGGVIGCSVAYHLTKLGWRDVVLLERAQLTAGTTWHAAGLITSGGFRTETSIEMAKYTVELCGRLGDETGQDTGFRAIGHLELANNAEELEGVRRALDFGRGFGIDIEEVSPLKSRKCGRFSTLEISPAGSTHLKTAGPTLWTSLWP